MRRGRPPYPDLLTPREQEVLALLREGLTNQQIAARLGISLYGARYHVSEILSKLGVSSREEAAAWQRERASYGFAVPVLALLEHFRAVSSTLSPWKVAGVAALGVAGVGLVLLLFGVIAMTTREDDRDPDCPVHPDACKAARVVERWVIDGNDDALVAHIDWQTFECPGGEPAALDQPFPLCTGVPAGETRLGMTSIHIPGHGSVSDEAGLREMLQLWRAGAQPGDVDEYGDGALRLVSIGCPGVTPDRGRNCREGFSLVFSTIYRHPDSGNAWRMLIAFRVEDVDGEAPRMGPYLASAMLLNPAGEETAMRGGEATGDNIAGALFMSWDANGRTLPGAFFAWPQGAVGLGKLVYALDGDIWTKALPGGVPRRLTNDGRNFAPQWSPSGEWVLFQTLPEGGPVIHRLMRSDGSQVRDLPALAAPEWAPSADVLTFVTMERDQQGLVTEVAETGDRTVLLATADHGWHGLHGSTWSPDGAWIAVAAVRLGSPFPAEYAAIWAVRDDGSEARELLAYSDTRFGLLVAGWTPDSRKVIYSLNPSFSASYISDGLQWEVVSLDPTVDDPEPSSEIEPPKMVLRYKDFRDVAPDGRVVAVRGGYRYVTERKAIALVDFTNGVGFTDLTPEGRAATSPAWAPDGSAIAFTMQPEDTTGDLTSVAQKRIWLMDGDGDNLRRLTTSEAWEEYPQWSRDGRSILYAQPASPVSEAPGEVTLWLHDLAAGSEREVLRLNLAGAPGSASSIGYYGHIDWDQVFDWWQP